jgi:predicted ester cyclase
VVSDARAKEGETGMSLQTNKEVIRRHFEEIFNQQHLEIIEAITAQELIEHGVAPFQSAEVQETVSRRNGPEHMRATAHWLLSAFPDLHFTIQQMVAEGDLVAVRCTMQGTHQGPFQGLVPTGKRVNGTRTDIFRVVNGKVVEHWANRDDLAMFFQLGVIQAPQRKE